jgi:hypothetical protein
MGAPGAAAWAGRASPNKKLPNEPEWPRPPARAGRAGKRGPAAPAAYAAGDGVGPRAVAGAGRGRPWPSGGAQAGPVQVERAGAPHDFQ